MDNDFLEKRLAQVAAAVADKNRATMLCALMDGRAYTATELSVVADIAPSTASTHLARLTEQHLIECLPQGRHRYFRIAGPQVAETLEALMGLVEADKAKIRSKTPGNLRFARTCYDHMAGELAVALHNRFIELGWLHLGSYDLSSDGKQHFGDLGVHCTPSSSRRRFACGCMDWSERQFHLGGQLGTGLFQAFERRGWVIRQLDSRELILTSSGQNALNHYYGLALKSEVVSAVI